MFEQFPKKSTERPAMPKLVKKADVGSLKEGHVIETEAELSNAELLEIKNYSEQARIYLEKARINEKNFDTDTTVTQRTEDITAIQHSIEKAKNEQKASSLLSSTNVAIKEQEELLRSIAQVLEAGIALLIDTHGWLTETVRARPASKYDDIKRGIDVVAYQEKNGLTEKETALATDETMSAESARNKLNTILTQIRDNNLPKLRYFESASPNPIRKLEVSVPKIVIALSRRGILEMGRILWGRNSTQSELYTRREDNGGKIALQELVLKQLTVLAEYAKKHNQNSVARLYQERISLLEDSSDRRELLRDPEIKKEYDLWINNPAFQTLFQTLKTINEEKY